MLLGFTAIPAGSTKGAMSSGYVYMPQASPPGGPVVYQAGMGPYQGCTPKTSPLPTAGYSATTIDPAGYPNSDTSFFTTEQFAGAPVSSASAHCAGYEWATSWALVPN